MSDPPTNTQYGDVWVTVDGVEASVSTSDTGWVPLVSNLSSTAGSIKAVQLDLLKLPTNGTNSNCLLALLGSTTSLPAGNYQQIRLILVPNSAPDSSVKLLPYSGEPSNAVMNQCANVSAWNCAMPTGGSLTALQLSSQAQTGLKIPPGQIMGGPIDVTQGSSVDINIDFNADRSIVQQGSGTLRLDPVLVAYQTSPNLTGISGQVFEGTVSGTSAPYTVGLGNGISGANIAVEMNSGNPKDNNVPVDLIGNYITTTDSSGNFDFCPLPTGPLDLVATAGPTTTTPVSTYGATIVTGVPNGVQVKIPIVPQQYAAGAITGQVTAKSASSAASSVTADVFALQAVPNDTAPTLYFAVPLLGSSTPLIAQIDVPCDTTTGDCSTSTNTPSGFTLVLPANSPLIGSYDATMPNGVNWSQLPSTTGSGPYTVEATCNTSTTSTPSLTGTFATPSPVTVSSGSTTPLASGQPAQLQACQ